LLRSVKYGLYGAVLAGVVGGTVAFTATGDKTIHLMVDGRPQLVHTSAADVSAVLQGAGYHPNSHDLVAPSLASTVHDGSTIVFKRGRLLKLDVNGTPRFVWTTAPTVAQALSDLGFSTSDFTSVSRSRRLPLSPTDIALRTPKSVTVVHDGTRTTVTTTDRTVGQLLQDLSFTVGPNDRVSAPTTAALRGGEQIKLTRYHSRTKITHQAIPYKTKTRHDASLPSGTTKIVTQGRKGVRAITWSLVYVDGKFIGKAKMNSVVLRQPVTRVERVGTRDEQPSSQTPNSPQAPIPSPGTAQAIARHMLAAYGWSTDQYNCLDQMWSRESGWRVNAANPSGAYGIPQALPGSKMASAGPDWETNARTQITWGLNYIRARYNSPCQAWSIWQSQGWY
jgi:resuscitation-promoting factor RpfB